MKFRRKADTTPTTADGSAEDATSGPAAATGPFDVSQVEGDGIDRADLGSVLVPPIAGRELRLQVDEQSGQVRAVIAHRQLDQRTLTVRHWRGSSGVQDGAQLGGQGDRVGDAVEQHRDRGRDHVHRLDPAPLHLGQHGAHPGGVRALDEDGVATDDAHKEFTGHRPIVAGRLWENRPERGAGPVKV